MDGHLYVLQVPNFNKIDSLFFTDIPVLNSIAMSPDATMLALGCKSPRTTTVMSSITNNHIYDIKSHQIVRTSYQNASDAIGFQFNPTSNMVVIGSKAVPQIGIWNLSSDIYDGSLSGSNGTLNDFKLSPEGHSFAAAASSDENLVVNFFSFPESNENDSVFSILNPAYKKDSLFIQDTVLLGTSKSVLFNKAICDTGKVPLYLYYDWFAYGINYKLQSAVTPYTLLPGECKNIPLIYTPKDTGLINDFFVIYTCQGELVLNLKGLAKDRNIFLFNNPIEIQSVCVSDTIIQEFQLLRNNDTVPLKINYLSIEDKSKYDFEIITPIVDTILKPN